MCNKKSTQQASSFVHDVLYVNGKCTHGACCAAQQSSVNILCVACTGVIDDSDSDEDRFSNPSNSNISDATTFGNGHDE